MPSKKRSDPNPATEPERPATGVTGPSEGTWAYSPLSSLPPEARPAHVEDAPAPERRTYRARQAVFGPLGRVRAGEIVILEPSSGLARSVFVTPIEPEDAPDAVAAAFAAVEAAEAEPEGS